MVSLTDFTVSMSCSAITILSFINYHFMESIQTSSQLVVMTAEDLQRTVQEAVETAMQRMRDQMTLPTASDEPEVEEYLSRDEVAQILGVDISTLWRWAESGYLPCVHFGRKVKYLPSVIKLFVERNKGKFKN